MADLGIRLTDLSYGDAEKIRVWRNASIQNARTPYLLTEAMQGAWYDDVVCNRDSPHRYWAVCSDYTDSTTPWWPLVGIAGLTDIDRRIQTAEVSLMVGPEYRGRGFGGAALQLLLDKAFYHENLRTVIGECYACNDSLGFWKHEVAARDAWSAWEPMCQFWSGLWWDSYRFKFFRGHHKPKGRVGPKDSDPTDGMGVCARSCVSPNC